jgi:hypothetical protein
LTSFLNPGTAIASWEQLPNGFVHKDVSDAAVGSIDHGSVAQLDINHRK